MAEEIKQPPPSVSTANGSTADDRKALRENASRRFSEAALEWLKLHVGMALLAVVISCLTAFGSVAVIIYQAGATVSRVHGDLETQKKSLEDIRTAQASAVAQADARLETIQKEFREVSGRLAASDQRVETAIAAHGEKMLASVRSLQTAFEGYRAALVAISRMQSSACSTNGQLGLAVYKEFAARHKPDDLPEGIQADLFDQAIKAAMTSGEPVPFTEAEIDRMAAVIDRHIPAAACGATQYAIGELYLHYGAVGKSRVRIVKYARDMAKAGWQAPSYAHPYALLILADVADDSIRDEADLRRALAETTALMFDIRPIGLEVVRDRLIYLRDSPLGQSLRARQNRRFVAGVELARQVIDEQRPMVRERVENGKLVVTWVEWGVAKGGGADGLGPKRQSVERSREYPIGYADSAFPMPYRLYQIPNDPPRTMPSAPLPPNGQSEK